MGVGDTFAEAYHKSQLGSGTVLPTSGKAFLSVRQADREKVVGLAKDLLEKGFTILATRGTAKTLEEHGIDCEVVNKVTEGRPNIVDAIVNEEVDLIVNTSDGSVSIKDSSSIRREALMHKVCYTTTMAGALAMVSAMAYQNNTKVTCLQTTHSA